MVSAATAFWNDYARHYDVIWDSPITTTVRDTVRGLLGTPATVLDLGCGTGLLSVGWASRGAHVIGVDTSELMLDRAIANSRITQPVVAPAEAVPLADGIAEAAIIGNLLHVHDDPAAVVREARRLVTSGGAIAVTWPVAGLTADAMWRLDRNSGRGILSSVVAHTLRMRVGIRAGRSGGAVAARAQGRRDTADLEALLAAERPSGDLGVVAGCQRIVVL